MNNIRYLILSVVMGFSVLNVSAQEQESTFRYGMFNHLSIGANVGTTGWGLDAATCVSKYVGLRVGFSSMPGFKFNSDLDVEAKAGSEIGDAGVELGSVNVKGSLARTQVELLVDLYPFNGFFITGGFAFGGSKIVSVKAHSDRLKEYIDEHPGSSDVGILIDKYFIPADRNGDINGELKVSGFRPYLGMGFGTRAVSKSRLSLRTELGVQFHGKPKVTANGSDVFELVDNADLDDEFSKIVDKMSFYPVIKMRLSGRIL